MKKLLQLSFLSLLLLSTVMVSCRKENTIVPPPENIVIQPWFSTIPEFQQGIAKVVNLSGEYNIIAYLDTMQNGYPDRNGRKVPLVNFGTSILQKLHGNTEQLASGVYDVFHFDGATFSLISFIRKAQMMGDISAQTMITIIAFIPLPPIPVADFTPPTEMVALDLSTGDCCKDKVCNPVISINVTWVHVAPCGNYDKSKSGGNKKNELIDMPTGQSYRFDAQISGCPCPGTMTCTITDADGGKSAKSEKGNTAEVFPITAGTYTITFTYIVCGKPYTATFTLKTK